MAVRRGAGAVERGSLENCWPFTGPVSSNLTPAVQQVARFGAPGHLYDTSVPDEIRAPAARCPRRSDGRRVDGGLVRFRRRAAALPPPVTLPTLTLPTVTVPPVTTPVVTTPVVTTPTAPLPPQAPSVPNVTGGTPPAVPPPPLAFSGGTTGGSDSSSSGRTDAQGGGSETSREQASRLRPALRVNESRTTLVVVLRKPALVELVVREVAPDCRGIGRFRVPGRRGVNRIRFRRLGRDPLGPGTYTVVARALPSGRAVGRARFVVADHAIRADACAGSDVQQASGSPQPLAGALALGNEAKTTPDPIRHRGVLGAKVGRGAFPAAADIPLWVYGLLALAVGMLVAAASLPEGGGLGLSESLRLALVGAGILLGLAIAFVLG